MADLFSSSAARKPEPPAAPARRQPKMAADAAEAAGDYTAHDIEVLEGLEPVRRRPGMYIGGTDERALHHLVAEVLDNSMDEAVAGHARAIDLVLESDGAVSVRDDGRGIPVDPHPKFPDKSALEVILTTLHSGGKFGTKTYQTSGGLHGVGVSVVNALSDRLVVEVVRNGKLHRQHYSRGLPLGPIAAEPAAGRPRGTAVRFHPDPEIFGEAAHFEPGRLFRMARSKAYLYRGVTIRWRCAAERLPAGGDTPAAADLHFPNGLADYLAETLSGRPTVTPKPFAGEAEFADSQGRMEWAIAWPLDEDGLTATYCNTIPTPQGGTHEQGLRNALIRSLRAYAELVGNRKGQQILPEDIMGGAAALLSVFIREPQFQGQTKDKLASQNATRLVEQALKDRFDLWLTADPAAAGALLDRVIFAAETRLKRREEKEVLRQTATRRLALPGKLADCSGSGVAGKELFLVEGDSAGGSAKQARNRETQAILPLRGKILNVASASSDKQAANKELADLVTALGCGIGKRFDLSALRYERIVIMTDADVDGAHIASLLMTFFFRDMRPLVERGHLYLAQPPLYRLTYGTTALYARDDAHKEQLLRTTFKNKPKVEISRFKGLGEMTAPQLKETTMDPARRTLLRVTLPLAAAAAGLSEEGDDPAELARAMAATEQLVEDLMGRRADRRFQFIQDNAKFAGDLDV